MWRVVIIDDEAHVRRGMKKAIPWEELNCVWSGEASDGKEGEKLIEEVNPDIIITDIYMPVMNGLEMIQAVKEKNYSGKVIILSGYNDFDYARQALRLKIDDYLSKPASLKTITSVLKNISEQLDKETAEKLKEGELKEKINMYEPLLEREWINSLLNGTEDLIQSPASAEFIKNKWEGKAHVVVAVFLNSKCLEESNIFKSDKELFKVATQNILEELTGRYFEEHIYSAPQLHEAVLCINFNVSEKENNKNLLQELCQLIETNFDYYLGIKAAASVGGVKGHWTEIGNSYKEAVYSLKEKNSNSKFTGHHSLQEADGMFSHFSYWSSSLEARNVLSESIRHANANSANEVIDQFISKVEKHPFVKSHVIRYGIEVWTVISYSLNDHGIQIEEIFGNDFDLYLELSHLKSWAELHLFIKEAIRKICLFQQKDENYRHRKLVEQAVGYIESHLDENITLQQIADELGISRNYLGQLFRRIVGEPYKNYLTRIRMEKAKQMIQEGNYLIYEISEKVGYDNPTYFATTFKNFTGYTPTALLYNKPVES